MGRVFSKRLGAAIVLVFFCCWVPAWAQDDGFPVENQNKVRESLFRQLTRAGFEGSLVDSLLRDQRWELSLVVLEKNLVYRESKANYEHVLDTYSTSLARSFLRQHGPFLEDTEREYGVEKEIIVAILLIESSLGRYVDGHRVFNTLSTLSQAAHPEVFPLAFDHISQSYPDMTQAYLNGRAKKKSQWAFGEMKAFLEIGVREGLDILEVKGSWAGAFGLPQFLPTSYLTYAVDGDGDQRVRLHDPDDAMASVANYLRAHGWRPGLAPSEMKKILFRYNRSRLYGETVLQSATILTNQPASSQTRSRGIIGKRG